MKRIVLLGVALVAAVAWAAAATSYDQGSRVTKGNLTVNGNTTLTGTTTQTGVATYAAIDAGNVKADSIDAGVLNVVANANVGGTFNVNGATTMGGTLSFGLGANVASTAAGGSVSIITADVTSSGASNLISYTLPANALNATNRCLRVYGWGTILNNANAKTVALDFGSQTVISKILTPSIANTTWSVRATVCRSGSNTQDIYAEALNPMGTAVSSTDGNTILYQAARTAGTQTDTSTIVIKGKTTTATTTDVTMDGMTVEFF